MSERGKTLLRGHALRFEGAAHTPLGQRKQIPTGPGHAKCECGKLSPDLRNTERRKRWHRDHKNEIWVRAAETERDVHAAIHTCDVLVDAPEGSVLYIPGVGEWTRRIRGWVKDS